MIHKQKQKSRFAESKNTDNKFNINHVQGVKKKVRLYTQPTNNNYSGYRLQSSERLARQTSHLSYKMSIGYKNLKSIERKVSLLNKKMGQTKIRINSKQKQNILKEFHRQYRQSVKPNQLDLRCAQRMMLDFERTLKKIKKDQLINGKSDQVKQNGDKFQIYSVNLTQTDNTQCQSSIKFGDGIQVLCDGHGSNGKQVANFICNNIYDKCYEKKKEGKLDKNQIYQIFIVVSKQLELSGVDIAFSGSTCLLVAIFDRQIIVANLGDSRVVLKKQHRIQTFIPPHVPSSYSERERVQSIGGVVKQQQLSKGKFSGPLRIWAPGKNSWGPGLAISRAFGNKAARRYGLISQPQIMSYQLAFDQKMIVIGSKGLFESIKYEQIFNFIKKHSTKQSEIRQKACQMLAEEALKKNQQDTESVSIIMMYF